MKNSKEDEENQVINKFMRHSKRKSKLLIYLFCLILLLPKIVAVEDENGTKEGNLKLLLIYVYLLVK